MASGDLSAAIDLLGDDMDAARSGSSGRAQQYNQVHAPASRQEDCLSSCLRAIVGGFARFTAEYVRIGDRLIEVGDKLADGGFSQVFRVTDTATGEEFALKRMLLQTTESQSQARDEVTWHLAFRSPQILRLVGHEISVLPSPYQQRPAGGAGGSLELDRTPHERCDMLMPLMAGGTIEDALNPLRPAGPYFPERRCLTMLRSLLQGLATMHGHSPPVAHRDVKTHNCMLASTGDDECILADLGSARSARQAASTARAAARIKEEAEQRTSMPYRAPELWEPPRPEGVTEAVDVWAAGCVGFAMAYGYSPFECSLDEEGEGTVQAVSHLRVLGTVPFPGGDRDDISVEIAERDSEEVHDVDAERGAAAGGAGAGAALSGGKGRGSRGKKSRSKGAGGAAGAGVYKPHRPPRYSKAYRLLLLSMLRKRPSSRPSAAAALRSVERLLGESSARGGTRAGAAGAGARGKDRSRMD